VRLWPYLLLALPLLAALARPLDLPLAQRSAARIHQLASQAHALRLELR
jgi:hypothetical protein